MFVVSTRHGRKFRQLVGVQPGAFGFPGRPAAGRAAAHVDPAAALPDGLCLDCRAAHDDAGRPSALAQLGRDALVRLPAGHHRLYNRAPLRRRSSQRGTHFRHIISAIYVIYIIPTIISTTVSVIWKVTNTYLPFEEEGSS